MDRCIWVKLDYKKKKEGGRGRKKKNGKKMWRDGRSNNMYFTAFGRAELEANLPVGRAL